MTYDDKSFAGGDDRDKLLPEWGRSSDEQIIWLALGILALLGLLFFGASRCGDTIGDLAGSAGLAVADGSLTIDELLSNQNDLSVTDDAFELADINSDLGNSRSGPYTVFAPVNSAWDEVADASDVSTDNLFDDLSTDEVGEAVGFHVVEGEYTLDELVDLGEVTTIDGYTLTFDSDDMINGVLEFEEANLEASNGIVHKISGVLPAEAAAPEPTPAPTAAPDPTPEPEPTPVPTAVPEPTPEPTPQPAPEPTAVPPAVTIGSLAGETSDLSTLTTVVGALGLDADLGDPDAGPFTVFAPNDDAFAAAEATLETFDESDGLQTIQYHVVDGIVPSSEVVPGARFETIGGETLIIAGDGSLPGGFSVLTADLETDNGIVHIIDGVMIPVPLQLRSLNDLFALEPIQFDVSSAVIRAESIPTLDNAAAVIKGLPDGTAIEVGGHTDSDGDDALNQALSEARANSVRDYLIGAGVGEDQLTAVGYGESQLKVDPETSAEDKQANRRIEFARP